jgi:micrococcal nuclease
MTDRRPPGRLSVFLAMPACLRRAFRSLLLAAALLLSVLAAFPSVPRAQGFTAVVRHIVDGDTLVLDSGERVRLLGIDAPELAHDGAPAQYHAAESRQALAGLAAGHVVRLVPGSGERDRHGRLVAWVFLPGDGPSLNERMVRAGCAFHFPHPEHGPSVRDLLLPVQIQAMEEGRGFWPAILALPVPSGGYVGNGASLRFFPPDCPYGKAVGARRRVAFRSVAEAFAAGYAPARTCPFWPPAR